MQQLFWAPCPSSLHRVYQEGTFLERLLKPWMIKVFPLNNGRTQRCGGQGATEALRLMGHLQSKYTLLDVWTFV